MTEPTTAVAARPEITAVVDTSEFSNLLDTNKFAHIQRVGKMFANSSLVPDHFRGKEADCVIAVEMAIRLRLHPFNLMQSLYVVHGKPGMEAKMAIALINSSGLYKGPLQFKLEGEGMDRKCTAMAIDKASGQVCEAVCSMDIAKAEGWIDKTGSKWKTMPDMMLQYRSASFFGRLYCPQVLFGMQTKEELDDIPEVDITPAQPAAAKVSLKERLADRSNPAQEVVVEPETPAATQSAPATHPEAPAQPRLTVKELVSMMKKVKTKETLDEVMSLLDPAYYSPQDIADVKKWAPGRTE